MKKKKKKKKAKRKYNRAMEMKLRKAKSNIFSFCEEYGGEEEQRVMM